jgi:hypothetical protein
MSLNLPRLLSVSVMMTRLRDRQKALVTGKHERHSFMNINTR